MLALPDVAVPSIVREFEPVAVLANLPSKAVCKSVWSLKVPVMLPQVALLGIVIVTLPLASGWVLLTLVTVPAFLVNPQPATVVSVTSVGNI